MADPLSALASIAGIATAAVQLTSGLYRISSHLIVAPKEIAHIAQLPPGTVIATAFISMSPLLTDKSRIVQKKSGAASPQSAQRHLAEGL